MIYDINDYIEGIVPEHAPITCPFHDDRKASAMCMPVTKLFFCFGCRIFGDQIECAKRLWFPDDDWQTGLSLAAAFLRQQHYPIVTNQFNGQLVVPSPAEDPRISEMMTLWCRMCHENLQQQPRLVERIRQERGIQHPLSLGLGVASYRLFHRFNKEIKDNPEGEHLAARCGIVFMPDERMIPYDRRYKLDDRIIIPELRTDAPGKRVIYFQARAQAKEHRLRYLNPKGLPRPVFGWESLQRPTAFVWFVEGVFDMLPLLEAGQAVVSCNGLGFNDKILTDLSAELKGRPLAIVFDNDRPNEQGESPGLIEGIKRVQRLTAAGVEAKQIIPPYKDVGEWIAAAGVQTVISSVTWRM